MSFLAKSGLLLANVFDYGAKGDGATDDTVAIQSAIDDVIATSNLGGVFFPPGNFQVSLTGLTVVAAANFRMLGAGETVSKIQFIAEDQGGVSRTLLALSGGCSFVEITGLDLDGNQANLINPSTLSVLLNTGDTSDFSIYDCITQNAFGRVIVSGDDITQARRLYFRELQMLGNNNRDKFHFTAVREVYVERCVAQDNGGGFLQLLETTVGPLSNANIFIRDNWYNDGGQSQFTGIFIQEVFTCEISRNSISGGNGELTADSAIRVDAGVNNVFDVDIRDNHLVGSFDFSIVMTPEDGNINRFAIVGNRCSDDIRMLPGATGSFLNSPVINGNWGFGPGFTVADYSNLPNNAAVVGGMHNDGQGSSNFSATQWTGTVNPEATQAVGTLAMPAQPLNTETVTLGLKTYTFQTVLTNVDGNVLIGATAIDSLLNLIAAINLGAGAGVTYAALTTANVQATAQKDEGASMTGFSTAFGVGGNTVVSTETLTGVGNVWSAATLLGALDGVSGSVGDTYQRLNGAVGTVFWQKITGSGPTGWGAIAGSSGALGAVKDLFVLPPGQSVSTVGNHVGSSVPVNGNGNLEIHIPEDFRSIVGANVQIIPGTTLAAADIDLSTEYALPGEQSDAHSESNLGITFPWVAGEITEIDVSSVFTAIRPGDTVGLVLDNNSVTGGYVILGFHFEYR